MPNKEKTLMEEHNMEMKFYKCPICGQMVAIVKKTACPVVCGGKPMEEIIPGTTDASLEKHVPVWCAETEKGL